MWTQFMDMHSGGGRKLDWEYIYIEAPQAEAEIVFYNRFGRNPHRVTCTCCGNDYSLSSEESLAQLTGYERGCKYVYELPDGRVLDDDDWRNLSLEDRRAISSRGKYIEQQGREYRPHQSIEDYMKRDDVTFIPASHIKPEERHGSLPEQGYVWVD
jgi:hypothetical protein